MEKKTGPVAVDLSDVKAAEKLIEDNEVVVIGFFKAKKSEKAKLFLEEAAGESNFKPNSRVLGKRLLELK